MKLKLYKYPNASEHIHDNIPVYNNCVPLSQKGINDHCELVSPEEANYFYCGQFADSTPQSEIYPNRFEYFYKCPEKHIVDIEGDQSTSRLHKDFLKCILTINGAPLILKELGVKAFVRPTFSPLLVDLTRNNRLPQITLPKYKRFGFRGLPDRYGVRLKVGHALAIAQLPCEYRFTSQWHGPDTDLNSEDVREYERIMSECSFSLCPRGNGIDTVRVYETCAFGRIPIIIGKNLLCEERYYDMSFTIRLRDKLGVDELAKELTKIYSMSYVEIIDRCYAARTYFDKVIKKYFDDPTKMFLNYLQKC